MNYFLTRNNELVNNEDISIFFKNLNFIKVFSQDLEIENF